MRKNVEIKEEFYNDKNTIRLPRHGMADQHKPLKIKALENVRSTLYDTVKTHEERAVT